MTKEEFYNRCIKKTKEEIIKDNDGVALHLKVLFENNNAKSIFKITGLDFSDMLDINNVKSLINL